MLKSCFRDEARQESTVRRGGTIDNRKEEKLVPYAAVLFLAPDLVGDSHTHLDNGQPYFEL